MNEEQLKQSKIKDGQFDAGGSIDAIEGEFCTPGWQQSSLRELNTDNLVFEPSVKLEQVTADQVLFECRLFFRERGIMLSSLNVTLNSENLLILNLTCSYFNFSARQLVAGDLWETLSPSDEFWEGPLASVLPVIKTGMAEMLGWGEGSW